MELNEKQVQILEVAERLFAGKGYDGTSVRDIALEAGVNVAMISYYFGSKEKLLEAMFVHRIAASRLTIESLVQDKVLTPTQKIEKLVDNYIDKMMLNPNFHRLSLRTQLADDLKNISTMISQTKIQNMELIRKIIQEGQRKKEFGKHIEVPLLMATMIGTFHQVMSTLNFHRMLNKMEEVPEEEFQKFIVKKLKSHLKFVIKAILTHEEQ